MASNGRRHFPKAHSDFLESMQKRSRQIWKGGIFARGLGATPFLATAAHAYIGHLASRPEEGSRRKIFRAFCTAAAWGHG